ncbi:hypothetical protein [Nocardia seriolae]|uniref:hypothetical protein n=1 Tax=Nocardia seriolae TaxID=37332 RepID=UPI00051A0BDE|nr:hypothetical protein [Nocardia seriolae]MTJ63008.1 hypothetical protein [Nocardia seriolae]MTJ75632.1 hypothetical protein [Nocardia seriolae]MTJ88034.1 hypothetical protein [Nocardia seriolae]MTK42079.1 hypothetical protein [Nocardia seriolae]MTK48603.1 hypothetical protein [Nocardia seriolae]
MPGRGLVKVDDLPIVEIRALRDVIDVVEDRLRRFEAAHGVVLSPRSEGYAAVIYAVIASARASGDYGAGSLARAPLLDEILTATDAQPWERAIYAVATGTPMSATGTSSTTTGTALTR